MILMTTYQISVNMPRVLQIVHCYRPCLLATPTNNQCIPTVHAWVHRGKGCRSKNWPTCMYCICEQCLNRVSVFVSYNFCIHVHVHVYVHIVYGGDTKKLELSRAHTLRASVAVLIHHNNIPCYIMNLWFDLC